MKPAHTVLLVFSAAVLSAIGTGWLVIALAITPAGGFEHSAVSPEVIVATPVDESSALLAKIDDLQMENSLLQGRLEQLEQRATGSERTPVGPFALQAALDELAKEVRSLQRTAAPGASVPDEFKEQIAGALTEIRREEKFEAVRKYQEQRAERIETDLEKLAGWLELDDYQVDEVRDALLVQYEREDEQRRLWEAGESDEVLAERKQQDGELFWADMQVFLTPEQFETFRTSIASRGK